MCSDPIKTVNKRDERMKKSSNKVQSSAVSKLIWCKVKVFCLEAFDSILLVLVAMVVVYVLFGMQRTRPQ